MPRYIPLRYSSRFHTGWYMFAHWVVFTVVFVTLGPLAGARATPDRWAWLRPLLAAGG